MKKFLLLTLLFCAALCGSATVWGVDKMPDARAMELMRQCCPMLAQKIEQAPGELDPETLKELEKFMQQVLPLYEYQMRNRVAPQMADMTNYAVKQLYQSPKDGCYFGLGDKRNTYNPAGIDCAECTEAGGKLKASGSYAWGMTQMGDKVYWSTNNNYLCMPGYGRTANPDIADGPYENEAWVCEYELGIEGVTKQKYGDIQKPRIFEYDTKTGVVRDITPNDTLLDGCQGLRSAAAHHGIIFFGGPAFAGANMTSSTSSVFLAYSPEQGRFIGSSDMSQVGGCRVTNVRRWIIVNDVLYCGVGIIDKQGVSRGAILRWYGDMQNPFKFEIVGWTPTEAAEIEYHNGRIYAGGWPNATTTSALYRSPKMPQGGFTADNATEWETVWRFSDYEVNPASQKMSYFSVMKSYKGKLYWGMFSNTFGAMAAVINRFGSLASADAIAYLFGFLRSTTLFRTDDFNSPNDIEMLYGEEELPVYDETTKEWSLKPNNSGLKPVFGRSGYGNLFTCYTWSMSIYNDDLYIGTMDMSNLIEPAVGPLLERQDFGNSITGEQLLNVLKSMLRLDPEKKGFELLRLSDHNTAPVLITDNGFGNPAAYGIRNMQVHNNVLYVGTANPLNLHEKGGWEIHAVDATNSAEFTTLTPARVMYQRDGDYHTFSAADGTAIATVTITDAAGQVLTELRADGYRAVIPTSALPKGILIAIVRAGDGTPTTFKIVN